MKNDEKCSLKDIVYFLIHTKNKEENILLSLFNWSIEIDEQTREGEELVFVGRAGKSTLDRTMFGTYTCFRFSESKGIFDCAIYNRLSTISIPQMVDKKNNISFEEFKRLVINFSVL